MNKIKTIGIQIICMIFLSLFVQKNSFALDKIVAVVNNDIITQKDLNDFLNFTRMQLRQQYSGRELESKIQSMKVDLINRMIDDKLIIQEAKRYGVIVDEARIKSRLDEIKKQYPSDAVFQKSLKQQGLVPSDIENKIREQFLMFNAIAYFVKRKITVSPSEVTNFYNDNTDQFNLPEEREFDAYLVDDEVQAKEASLSLKSGASQEEIEKKYNLVPNRMNAFKVGEFKKEIEDAVFSIAEGKVSDPVFINSNYYIFKIIKINPPKQLPFSEAKEKVYDFLFNQKLEQELIKWIADIKKRSYIKLIQD